MGYDFDGRKYEKASSHQKEWGMKLIGELDLKGNERVLDLGCGDGWLTLQIARQLPEGEVTGIDSSAGMIAAARPKASTNLTFLLRDIDDINFVDAYDLVFSNAALHWVKDHEKLLVNVRNALRHNGRVRFNFAGAGNCTTFFMVLREAMAREEFAPYFSTFNWPWFMPSVEEYRLLVSATALCDTVVRGENADRYFPDAETLTRWVDQPSLVPILPLVPEKEPASFRGFVVHRMIEETLQENGSCFETFRRINLSARK